MTGIKKLILFALVMAFAGCDGSDEPSKMGGDVALTDMQTNEPDGSTSGDASVDTGGPDVASPTDMRRLPDVATADTGSVDAGPDATADAGHDAAPDAGDDAGSVCDGVLAELADQRQAVGTCDRSSECGSRYNSTCPEGGCFVHYNVNNELDALQAAEASYADEMCGGGAVCDCAPPPEVSCNNGQCGACPQTCSYTCALDCTCSKDACGCDLAACAPSQAEMNCNDGAARISVAAEDGRACAADQDCIVDASPICPEVGCHYVRNRNASRAHLDALVAEYVAGGCNLAVCACTAPPDSAACVNGVCEGVAN